MSKLPTRPRFYALYKESNSGEMEKVDVLSPIFNFLLDSRGRIRKTRFTVWDYTTNERLEVKSPSMLRKFLRSNFMYYFWSKCEWEFLVVDWPPSPKDPRSRKIDVFDQIEPNLDVITMLVWNYLYPKMVRLYKAHAPFTVIKGGKWNELVNTRSQSSGTEKEPDLEA